MVHTFMVQAKLNEFHGDVNSLKALFSPFVLFLINKKK